MSGAITEQGLQAAVSCKHDESEQMKDPTDGVLTEGCPFLPGARSSRSRTSVSPETRALHHPDNYKTVNYARDTSICQPTRQYNVLRLDLYAVDQYRDLDKRRCAL
jgi:hypothetical protein